MARAFRFVLSLLIAPVALAAVAGSSQAKEEWVDYTSKEFQFRYPKSLGAKVTAKKVKASKLASPDDKPDEVWTEHWELSFDNPEAKVYLFPTTDSKVKDFKKAYPTVDDSTRDLKGLLKKQTAAPKEIPFLPWADQSSPFHSHVKYVNFKNGSTVRYLAEYQIEPEEISNERLVYSAQGLSKDGKYYVAVYIPVKTSILKDKSEVATWSADKQAKFSKDYNAYVAKEKVKLDKAAEGSFTPQLNDLDSLISSMNVLAK